MMRGRSGRETLGVHQRTYGAGILADCESALLSAPREGNEWRRLQEEHPGLA